jgi:hypothetical protein
MPDALQMAADGITEVRLVFDQENPHSSCSIRPLQARRRHLRGAADAGNVLLWHGLALIGACPTKMRGIAGRHRAASLADGPPHPYKTGRKRQGA